MLRSRTALLTRIVQLLPLILPAVVVCFGIAGMGLLLIGQFYLWLIIGIGTPLAVGCIWLIWTTAASGKRPGSDRSQRRLDYIVITGILLWTVCNVPFAAQHVLTDRDPATYAVAGAWLARHHNLNIPAPAGFVALPTMHADSLGFGYNTHNPSVMYAQGAHLLPVLLGFFGKLFGQTAMLSFNVIFGGVALLAFYSFARLVLRPRWSGLAVLVLGGTLPFIYFSRDTYTEPLTLLCIFSALTCFWYAHRSTNWRWWFLAGVFAGTSALLRVDTYLLLAALEIYVGIYLMAAPPKARKPRAIQVASTAVPAAVLGLLGWIDVSQLSSGYYRDLRTSILAQLLLIAALTVILALSIWVAWRTKLLWHLLRIVRRNRCLWLLRAGLATFFVVLAGRALFLLILVTLRKITVPVQVYSADTTVLWIGWYIGPVLGALGVVQLIRTWPSLVRGRLAELLPLALVVSADCALYLLNPNISPDQVWASRRFLPVIFPGLVIFGVLALEQLARHTRIAWWRYRVPARKVVPGLVVLAASLPLLTSLPFWSQRSLVELPQITAVCSQVPANAVVVWVGDQGGFLTQPTQAFCGVESFSTTASGSQLASLMPALTHLAAAQHKVVYLGSSQSQADLLPGTLTPHLISQLTYSELEHTYKRFPIRTISTTKALVLASVPATRP